MFWEEKDGGAEGVRTPDLLNAIQALYQLSYDPIQSDEKSKNLSQNVNGIAEIFSGKTRVIVGVLSFRDFPVWIGMRGLSGYSALMMQGTDLRRHTIGRLSSCLSGFAVLAMVSLAGLYPHAAGSAELPNIVIIFMDDMGYADIGVTGAKGYRTPNLDRLASEGTLFRNFHVAQPVCSASRAALLTGCYPNRLGIHGALGPEARNGKARARRIPRLSSTTVLVAPPSRRKACSCNSAQVRVLD